MLSELMDSVQLKSLYYQVLWIGLDRQPNSTQLVACFNCSGTGGDNRKKNKSLSSQTGRSLTIVGKTNLFWGGLTYCQQN